MTDLPIEKIYDSTPNRLANQKDPLIESLLCLAEHAILFCPFPLASHTALSADCAIFSWPFICIYHVFVLSRIVRIEKKSLLIILRFRLLGIKLTMKR